MRTCVACGVDYYHKGDVRIFFSKVCDHSFCEPCVRGRFGGRASQCPTCGVNLRSTDFSEQSREARQVESETKVRRQICDIMCKTRELFQSADEFDEYLVLREDLIHKLLNPASQEEVNEVWRYIEKYKVQNAEQISRDEISRPRRKVQKILGIIEEEGDFFLRVNADGAEREQFGYTESSEPPAAAGMPALAAPSRSRHPFRERYRDLIDSVCASSQGLKDGTGATGPCGSIGSLGRSCDASMSPAVVQPLLPPACDSNPTSPLNEAKDPSLHASGGGQVPDVRLRKARHYFFSNLAAAAAAAATTASVA